MKWRPAIRILPVLASLNFAPSKCVTSINQRAGIAFTVFRTPRTAPVTAQTHRVTSWIKSHMPRILAERSAA